MATWKKVVVSGSTANLAALQVDNLTSGQVVIGGGASNLSTTAVNGTGNIVATTGASGVVMSGSFTGSFTGALTGTASWATNATTATQVSSNLTQGTGITTFTYNGSSAQTVAVSGTVGMATNAVTKWTGNAFTASSMTDNGTAITGTTSIQLTGANSSLTGSFTGSFKGDGSGLTGVTAQASFPLTFGEGIGINAQGSSSYNGNQAVTITVSGAADLTNNIYVKWNNTDNKFTNSNIFDDGTSIFITGSTVIVSGASTAFIVTGSVRASGGFTGSLFGTSSYAITAATASSVSNLVQNVQITGSLFVSSSIVLTPSGSISVVSGSITALSFTGSLFGTSSWATNATTATQVANSLTMGNGLTGGPYNGSAAVTADVGAGAIITVTADAVMVTTSSLSANQIPKFSNNALSGSNISDTGTQVQIAAAASSGLSVAAGGITVTGNSTFNNSVTVTGDLTVAGTASFQNSTSLLVADKFVLLASGSTTVTDGGIIVATSTAAGGASGSAFYLESTTDASPNYGRWAVAQNIHASASAVAADEYMVSVKIAQGSNPSAAPTWGGATQGTGNMWITNAGDIFIYS